MPSLSTTFTVDKTINDGPARSVLQYRPGDKTSLTSDGFAAAAEIERKYVTTWQQTPCFLPPGAVNSTM